MIALPREHTALVTALAHWLREARAGLLLPELDEDPDALVAALDAASAHTGTPIERAWLGADRDTLVWLRADDQRLVLDPALVILGIAG